jgi:hypothetical protein
MKRSTRLRLFGGAVLLVNLYLVGRYEIQGVLALLMTFGFAIAFELLIVKPAVKVEQGGAGTDEAQRR